MSASFLVEAEYRDSISLLPNLAISSHGHHDSASMCMHFAGAVYRVYSFYSCYQLLSHEEHL